VAGTARAQQEGADPDGAGHAVLFSYPITGDDESQWHDMSAMTVDPITGAVLSQTTKVPKRADTRVLGGILVAAQSEATTTYATTDLTTKLATTRCPAGGCEADAAFTAGGAVYILAQNGYVNARTGQPAGPGKLPGNGDDAYAPAQGDAADNVFICALSDYDPDAQEYTDTYAPDAASPGWGANQLATSDDEDDTTDILTLFNPFTGKKLWTEATPITDDCPPVTNGAVDVAKTPSGLIAIDHRTGRTLWTAHDYLAPRDEQYATSPQIDAGDLITVSGPEVEAMDLATGKVLWKTSIGAGDQVSEVYGAGHILYTAGQHDLFALDPTTGAKLWQVPVSTAADEVYQLLWSGGRLYLESAPTYGRVDLIPVNG
jgi:hypothetical protein